MPLPREASCGHANLRALPELPFDRVWLPWIYLYGVGGLMFFAGLGIAVRSGACDLGRRRHRWWLGVMLFGYFWYAGIHLVGILAATA